MFGANIVQIKPRPGNRLSTLDPIPQEEVPSEETPKRQATFKIIRGQLIGKGTYGRVYLGMNATTGEFLAVKQVEVNHKAAGHDKERIKEMVAALDQEIDTMKDLEHPNIVQYLGFERKEFSVSIYLEYIPGGSIGSCLRKHGKFEESVVRSLTRQTLEGLAYLHHEGILHRDLKADNILLDLDGSCKISDFGISKKSDNIYGNDATNSMQGSVFWMAPEVVRSQGQGYSAKVDIWSLGCVVLEMFAGKRPWSREEAIGAIFKLGSLSQAPPIPEDVQSTATVDGLNFMYDCFQVNPSDRPTAETLLRHSSFCVPNPYYNFYDTTLAAKLRNADGAGLGA
ncbi:mitogen-activated protein kinase kinase kinase [Exophiala xenobiotica]|nr:mitogen-activated protein kinase kinase kinase [Exophiala xenobiotica]